MIKALRRSNAPGKLVFFLCLTIENQGGAWTTLEETEKEFFLGRKTVIV